jgi:hypothetical protein
MQKNAESSSRALTLPSQSPSDLVPQTVEAGRPPSKLGGWSIALLFLAVLVVLIVANM